MSFQFETVRRIESRPGAVEDLGVLVRGLSCRRLLVVTDSGIEKSGLLDGPLRSLRAEMDQVSVFSKVQADPPEAVVLEAVAQAREEKIDGIVGLGGGSSLDTAKIAALLACTPQKLDDIYGIGLARGERLPLVLIPTTAGTGSEVTPIAILTTPSTEKKGVVAPQLLPDIALLDAKLTLSVPPLVTAATGIDAMVHAIEAYTSKHLKNPLSDAMAVRALRLLHGNLQKVLANGSDLAGREAMLEGSMMAGMSFANAPVGAVHALAYPLGAHFHLPHGLCNALMLPHVLVFNAEARPDLYAELAEVVLPGTAGTVQEKARVFTEEMTRLAIESGLPRNLREAKIPESALPDLAEDAMKVERLLRNNPREVVYDDALHLYQQAWRVA
jgi:alcohol dehydrogenase class IV